MATQTPHDAIAWATGTGKYCPYSPTGKCAYRGDVMKCARNDVGCSKNNVQIH